MARSGLRTIRLLEWRLNKENAGPEKPEKTWSVGAAIEAEEKTPASKLDQKTFRENRAKNENQNDLYELKREQEIFEEGAIGKLPDAQPHRRRSRTGSKIAALRRGRRGKRDKRSVVQKGHSPNESLNSATLRDIPAPAES